LRKPPGARLDAELAHRVCRRIGADMVAAGEIARVGERFIVFVEVTVCASRTPFVQLQATADGKSEVLGAVSRVAGD